jgi:hypothetical protein
MHICQAKAWKIMLVVGNTESYTPIHFIICSAISVCMYKRACLLLELMTEEISNPFNICFSIDTIALLLKNSHYGGGGGGAPILACVKQEKINVFYK